MFGTAKRRGSLPPIIVVLVIMAAIVSTGLVVWFMISTTKSAVNQPMLEVTDAFYLSNNIFVTVRNIGPVNVTISTITATCQSGGAGSYATSTSIPKGTSQSIKVPISGTVNDGDLCVFQVTFSSPSAGSITLSFRVVKP